MVAVGGLADLGEHTIVMCMNHVGILAALLLFLLSAPRRRGPRMDFCFGFVFRGYRCCCTVSRKLKKDSFELHTHISPIPT